MAQIVIFTLLVGAFLLVLAFQKRWKRARSIAQGLLVSYTVIVVFLGGAEAYFRYEYTDSRMDFPLTRDNWRARFVKTNSLGFRDREWTAEELAQRQTIFAIGDSFTEGWGITDPADRYTDVLGALLGNDYAVVNLAVAGQATTHQIETLENHPYKTPDVVIYQYFLNDIEVAAKSNGMVWDITLPPYPDIVKESFLASYFYWSINRDKLYRNIVDGRSEWEYNYAAYDDAYIWQVHSDEIIRFLDLVESKGARLIVVIFPNMLDPVGSIPYVDRVAQLMKSQGVDPEYILKLTDATAAWTLEDRIVSPNDSHASVKFNHYLGETLYQQYFAGQGE